MLAIAGETAEVMECLRKIQDGKDASHDCR